MTSETPTLHADAPAPLAKLTALGAPTHAMLRIGAALLMMPHGAQKLFGVLGKTAQPIFSQMWLAGVLEFFGAALLALGLFTRPAAAILCLVMIVAYFMGHGGGSPWPILNKGELALLYALVFAFITANGSGPWSVDAWLRSRRGR